MKIDSTITISIILAICALFAPSITAHINNRHQYKIRKLELQYDLKKNYSDIVYNNKYNTYKNFLDIAGKYSLFNNYAKNFTEILSCTQEVLLLCDTETKPFIMTFIKGIEEHSPSNQQEYVILLSGIADSFNRELSTLSSGYNN